MTPAEGFKAANEADAMDAELSYHSTKSRAENQLESMYGNKKENNQPFPNSGWKKTLCNAYIFQKLDFKYATVKDRYCRTMCRMCLVGKTISQLELTERLGIVWDTYIPHSLKYPTREGGIGGKQVKMTSKTPDHLH